MGNRLRANKSATQVNSAWQSVLKINQAHPDAHIRGLATPWLVADLNKIKTENNEKMKKKYCGRKPLPGD